MKEIQKLRELTGAGFLAIRDALVASGGDLDKAQKILEEQGHQKAQKLSGRSTDHGVVATYNHNGRMAAVVTVLCTTDFVARSKEFQDFANQLAQQVVANMPGDLKDQDWIFDETKTVEDVRLALASRVGENIVIQEVSRQEI